MADRFGPSLASGFLAGIAGGAAGLAVMRLYWEGVSRFNPQGNEDRPPSRRTPKHGGSGYDLDDISLVGRQHRSGETSTAAAGRLLHHAVTGQDPSNQTQDQLDFAVHWAFGLSMGGIYGILRRKAGFPDLRGGLAFSSGVWLLGDELAVPILGLQGGPTAARTSQHLNRLCAHLAYGLGLAVTCQGILRAVNPRVPVQSRWRPQSQPARTSRQAPGHPSRPGTIRPDPV